MNTASFEHTITESISELRRIFDLLDKEDDRLNSLYLQYQQAGLLAVAAGAIVAATGGALLVTKDTPLINLGGIATLLLVFFVHALSRYLTYRWQLKEYRYRRQTADPLLTASYKRMKESGTVSALQQLEIEIRLRRLERNTFLTFNKIRHHKQ